MVEFAAFLFIVVALGWIVYRGIGFVVGFRAARAADPKTWDLGGRGPEPPQWLCDRCGTLNRTPSEGRGDHGCTVCGRQLTAITFEAGARIRESAAGEAATDTQAAERVPERGICRQCRMHFFKCRCPDGPDLPTS